MEDMSKMTNKAMAQPHRSGCKCELCLMKRAYKKADERTRHTKEEATVAMR